MESSGDSGENTEKWVQDWLFPYENPLTKRLGKEFFASIPKLPGVYIMYGVQDSVLYVGKAKNLRARLLSYRRAKPGQVPRKVIRLLNFVQAIRWEECTSEAAALLRENQLLREHCPPYNSLNTRPDTYYFLGFRFFSGYACFRLTMNPKPEDDVLYGAYKGRGSVRNGYQALLRLIWAAQHRMERFEFPSKLTRRVPPYRYTTDLPADWVKPLKKFLNGTSEEFLALLTEKLLENDSIPRFEYRMIQEDLETVSHFYLVGPKRNRHLRRTHKVKGRLIAQEAIDDLLVMEQARLGRVQGDPAAELAELTVPEYEERLEAAESAELRAAETATGILPGLRIEEAPETKRKTAGPRKA